jgi:hypothetical protein
VAAATQTGWSGKIVVLTIVIGGLLLGLTALKYRRAPPPRVTPPPSMPASEPSQE